MFHINCDASIEPFNPGGIVAWGFLVKANKKIVHKEAGISVKGGDGATNNVGEYHAVIAALMWLLKLPKEKQRPAIIKSDSQLIVNQCTGSWSCREEKLVPLHAMVQKACKRYSCNITFHWIPREENSEADSLSRTAYDEKELSYWRENHMNILFDGDDLPF